ncbi:hypothetical protein OGAPHI_006790 [Ogataea philodendri]|uniref:Bul1 N-terminal domain-containing protein n=1 Tax=Ogataea philodendri TaxID=1378263 RepID=A0A9P8T046_9ASCO|nr:uncharacterized protein OGAPHI_006790 [Ogataea philodendri]KAH3661383.1 hypothetical protein OGAPHI_006790 [Ogataea philodendri]
MEEAETTPYDVLPTFETHNELLNRTLSEIEQMSPTEHLPDYQSVVNGDTPAYSPTQTRAELAEATHHNSESLLLNNLDRIQKISSPIKISIRITKTFPQMGKDVERANPLREFHSGDLVTGCVTVTNISAHPIPFELFLVSLEGYITIPSIVTNTVAKHTFLRAFDFGACYLKSHFPTPNYDTPQVATFDEHDQTSYGFPETKVLEPGCKYKKFFYFKLPESLLECTCNHQIYDHFEKLPPSFGLDRDAFEGRAKIIAVNESLGYGRLQDIGSPILLNDQSEYGQSISYAVCTYMIGKHHDIYKKDPIKKYIMIKDEKHYIRFIPDESLDVPSYKDNQITPPPTTSSQLETISKEAQKAIDKLKSIKDLQGIGVKDNREADELSSEIHRLKKVELNLSGEQPVLESPAAYQNSVSISLVPKKKLFAFGSAKANEVLGNLEFHASIDKSVRLGYIVPSVLSKMASVGADTKAKAAASQVPLQSPLLSPVSSANTVPAAISPMNSRLSLTDTGSDSLESKLIPLPFSSEVEIQLDYNGASLPELSSIKPTLKSFSISSPAPIPVTFDPQFLLGAETPAYAILNLKTKFTEYLTQLKVLAKETGRGVEKQLFHDLVALSNVSLSQKTLPIFSEVRLKKQPVWTKTENGHTTKFRIKLNYDYGAVKTQALLPGFSICNLTKLYYLSLKLSFKKHSTKNTTLKIPIEVAKFGFGRNPET